MGLLVVQLKLEVLRLDEQRRALCIHPVFVKLFIAAMVGRDAEATPQE
jgi:hypothetical protein